MGEIMSREGIIREILCRFKLDKKSIKRLKDYEYDLIYNSLEKIEKQLIYKAIKDFSEDKFQVKTIRSTFYK